MNGPKVDIHYMRLCTDDFIRRLLEKVDITYDEDKKSLSFSIPQTILRIAIFRDPEYLHDMRRFSRSIKGLELYETPTDQ